MTQVETSSLGDLGLPVPSKWSHLLGFSALMNMIFSVGTICVMAGAVNCSLSHWACGRLYHLCNYAVLLICLLANGTYRFSQDDEACSEQQADLFKDHKSTITWLCLAQLASFCIYECYGMTCSEPHEKQKASK